MAGRVAVVSVAETRVQDEFIHEVASSATFAKAPALRRLLLYLWEHRTDPISEYSIALDALGKREDFDPKIDASVRVHVSRLRTKLKEYFETDGSHHPMRLVVPPGAHQLRCEARTEISIESPLVAGFKRWAMPVAVLTLLLACGALWVHNQALREDLALAQRNLKLPAIWQSILKPGRLTRVIYPIPMFYVWGELRVRDVKNNVRAGWRDSPYLKPLVEMYGEPQVSQSYTVSSDTVAAIQLTRFLTSHGVPLEVTPTRELSIDQYGSDNLIFLGIPPTNPSLDRYLNKTNFYLDRGNGAVMNREPRAGEKESYHPVASPAGSSTTEKYGLVAVLPGHAPGTSLVLLMGLQTSALGSFVSSPVSIESFSKRWQNEGSPEHFEVVVRTVTEGVTTKTAEVVAFRSVR